MEKFVNEMICLFVNEGIWELANEIISKLANWAPSIIINPSSRRAKQLLFYNVFRARRDLLQLKGLLKF